MTQKAKSTVSRDSTTCAARTWAYFAFVFVAIIASACSQLDRPRTEPFYSQTEPPPRQEFRWSNGQLPKTIDPARASIPSEIDVVRAVYEGLTELDPATLREVPGVAERWESSPDFKTWTFHLRKDSRWSNGKPVLADDFVRSWKRLVDSNAQTANKFLFENIVGMESPAPLPVSKPGEPADLLRDLPSRQKAPLQKLQADTNGASSPTPEQPTLPAARSQESPAKAALPKFGVEAVDDKTLRVALNFPDKDFPKLVASPIFRPIYGDGVDVGLDVDTVSNGAFRIASVADSGIYLERSETYWDRTTVSLEAVRIIPADTAEKALDAYKSGKVDAVSNAEFEPLALKLLAPFDDFRKTTHSALNFYEINRNSVPFGDRRVREALAISIDRERLTDGELGGSTHPAYSFLPLSEIKDSALILDVKRANDLLAKAGYPNGENFPQIRLVVNRNDTQQRVARTVAKMWRQNLNLDTLVIIKEPSEMEETRQSGDFDLIRRGVVIPTVDEFVSLSLLFGAPTTTQDQAERVKNGPGASTDVQSDASSTSGPTKTIGSTANNGNSNGPTVADQPLPAEVLSEEGSLFDIYAIPLYFPTSYALVKPYVRGFDVNGLDAPSLKNVTIDSGWQLKRSTSESN